METSENRMVCSCFQEVEKVCIENECVNVAGFSISSEGEDDELILSLYVCWRCLKLYLHNVFFMENKSTLVFQKTGMP